VTRDPETEVSLGRVTPAKGSLLNGRDHGRPADVLPSVERGAVLDPAVIRELDRLGSSVGRDLLAELAGMYLADTDSRLDVLRGALAEADSGRVFMSAHSVSGASANLGAIELARLCNSLAVDSGAGDLSRGEFLLEAIESEFRRVRSSFDSLLRKAL
jgi:hypothetical protein